MPRALLLLAASLAIPVGALAQTTFASITGMVTDPNGAIVPGAAVTATRIENNYKYTVRSNETGYYTIAQLLEGEYEVKVESQGFKVYIQRGLKLANQQIFHLDIHLELGSVSTTIEVKSSGSLIETESARIGDVKTTEVLQNMPLNTRSLVTMIGQNAGVFTAAGAGATATRRFSGSRNNQSDTTVDGITIGNLRDGTQDSNLVGYVESIQEVRVDMGNNSAEYGTLGQVTVISKGGTNTLHGSAFDYYQTPLFFARNPFALERVSNITHLPGASIGGPVYFPHLYNGKDKTFFYFSYETSRGSMIRNSLNPSVPLASWREGDFSALLPGTVIKDPFNGNTPFPNNMIPSTRINPVSQKIQSLYYPLPNFGNTNVFSSQNFRMTAIRPYDPFTYWTSRIDHRFTDRDFIFGRFTWDHSFSRNWNDNLPTLGRDDQLAEDQSASVSYSHTFRANLLNELRWGVAYSDTPVSGPIDGSQMIQALGIQGLASNIPDISGLLNVNWSGLGLTSLTQTQWRHPAHKVPVMQWQEQLSWFPGRHNLKFGSTISRVTYADGRAPANLFGNVTFSNRFTGHPYADFLLGIPTTAARSFPNRTDRQLHYNYDFFATDSFRITPRLTLDFGLRYELHTSLGQRDGLAASFDIGTGQIVVPDSSLNKVSPLMPKSYVNVVGASSLGLPQNLIYTDTNNFAPRIALAWRPLGNNTVFRAGYGIYYDIVPNEPTMDGVPFSLDEPTFTNPTTNPTVIFPLVFPGSSAGPSTVTLPTAVNPHLVLGYSMQYSFTIEHQQGSNAFRLSYIGTSSRKGPYGYNINQPVASTALFVNKPRLFPKYPAIIYLTNGAGHQFNGVTVEAKRRGAAGLTYQISYTLARDIGDLENMPASPPVTGEDAYNRQRERAVWLDIPTHRVNGNIAWDLPVGKNKKLLSNPGRVVNLLVGNWSLSAIYTFHSGHFLTPLWTGPDPTGTAYTTSATPASVTIRPNILHDPNPPYDQRTVTQWFDPTAFAAPSGGYFGSSAKGVIKGPHVNVFDVGLFKVFPIRERLTMRWELTGVNIFNHPNYSDPAAAALNITQQGQVGVLSAVGGVSTLDPSGARAFRMGLRVEF
ncbi:MAG TPA: TonB-dependent receptor [Bryobacteraceae bacterium]|nr:TonB-dependent receptor [Bryobacteraceae bacterium]